MSSGAKSVAIGIFDGVHLGHQEIIRTAAQFGPVTALTFHPHPTSIFAPEREPSMLLSLPDRIELLQQAGASEVVVLEFTKEFASKSPENFIDEVLIAGLAATHVTVGANFTFGHKAAGTPTMLAAYGAGNFEVSAVHLSENRGSAISSSRIRTLIVDGDVVRAGELLSRPFYIKGEVVHGEKRGRTIGYPTANIGLGEKATIPADGVYAGWLNVGQSRWPAAISIGTNPTFPGVRGRQVEAYAIGQKDLDLYGQEAKLEFTHRLRDTLKFDGLEPLLKQMGQDCRDSLRLLGLLD